jgi:hypothetical protein
VAGDQQEADLAQGAGFRPLTTEPDAEDMPYLRRVR